MCTHTHSHSLTLTLTLTLQAPADTGGGVERDGLLAPHGHRAL